MITTIKQRINISLPTQTIRLVSRVVSRGNRSRFIDEAVQYYIKERMRRTVRKQLKAGALARAAPSLGIAEEWLPLEEEVWQNHNL